MNASIARFFCRIPSSRKLICFSQSWHFDFSSSICTLSLLASVGEPLELEDLSPSLEGTDCCEGDRFSNFDDENLKLKFDFFGVSVCFSLPSFTSLLETGFKVRFPYPSKEIHTSHT